MRICGMDEVGRGALSGSLIACAVIISYQLPVTSKLRDSKKLSRKQRERIYKELMKAEVEFAVEEISVEEINRFGIGWANKEVFKRLIDRIQADEYIVDGLIRIQEYKDKEFRIRNEVKADSKYPEVMAASIIAKVTRDKHMISLHDEHEMYGWDRNVGYGTREHIEAIRKYGVTKYHRTKFVETALRDKAIGTRH